MVLKRATGLSLEAGRANSLGPGDGAGGLGALRAGTPARRRACGLLAVAAFAVFPLTIRYGRAFQPDAAMLGAVVAGLGLLGSLSIQPAAGTGCAAGWSLLALGFALKITAAFLLDPALARDRAERRSPRTILAACSTLLPALLWYAWADSPGRSGRRLASVGRQPVDLARSARAGGALEAGDAQVRGLVPVRPGVHAAGRGSCRCSGSGYRSAIIEDDRLAALVGLGNLGAGRDGVSRGETPSRVLLAAAGAGRRRGDRPLRWTRLAVKHRRQRGRRGRGACSCSAWYPGPLDLANARRMERPGGGRPAPCRRTVPRDAWVVAPEALLFQADRRGCRMEWTTPAAARERPANGEPDDEVDGPLDLLEYYRRQGARYFADLGSRDADPRRKGLHDAVRRRYKVIVDRPDVIIADLADSEMHWNAN